MGTKPSTIIRRTPKLIKEPVAGSGLPGAKLMPDKKGSLGIIADPKYGPRFKEKVRPAISEKEIRLIEGKIAKYPKLNEAQLRVLVNFVVTTYGLTPEEVIAIYNRTHRK